MIVLDSATRKLQVLLAGSATTTELPVVASFTDYVGGTPSFLPGASNTITTGATPVDVVGAPGGSTQRQVKYLTVYNADTVLATATVRYNDNGTTRIMHKARLDPGETLHYECGRGFFTTDIYGGIKNTFAPTFAGNTGRLIRISYLTTGTAATYTPSSGTKTCFVDINGGGGGSGQCAISAANAQIGPGGSAGSRALKTYDMSNGQVLTYTVGAGGGDSSNGGDSTITDGTTLVTAKGGVWAGTGSAGTTTLALQGGIGVVSTGGDANFVGMGGETSQRDSGTAGRSGSGGSSPYGAGGNGIIAAGVGNNGSGYAAGAGGSAMINGSATVAGAAGSGGLIIVYDFG